MKMTLEHDGARWVFDVERPEWTTAPDCDECGATEYTFVSIKEGLYTPDGSPDPTRRDVEICLSCLAGAVADGRVADVFIDIESKPDVQPIPEEAVRRMFHDLTGYNEDDEYADDVVARLRSGYALEKF